MKVEFGLNPNCSEAVFRFYTEDPEVARKILQAFADEVASVNKHPVEIVPGISRMEDVKNMSFGACAGLATYSIPFGPQLAESRIR